MASAMGRTLDLIAKPAPLPKLANGFMPAEAPAGRKLMSAMLLGCVMLQYKLLSARQYDLHAIAIAAKTDRQDDF